MGSLCMLFVACLALTAFIGPAAGAVVATDAYACDPAACKPPTCLCAANSPPGGLTPKDIPQFVLVSHDNALDGRPFAHLMKVLGDKKQANGCAVPVTFFAQRYHSDCDAGRQALARGDEVAMQANRFFPTLPFNVTDPSPNYDSRVPPLTGQPSVEREITMSREWWNQQCKLPLKDMVGYRSQGYYNNPPIRDALSKNGWLYDATLVERWASWSPTSPSQSQVLWPYTMDAGIPQECNFLGDSIGTCSAGETHAGLWEVPLYQLQEGETLLGFADYGNTESGLPAVPDMLALFKGQLAERLQGGRTPLQLSTFYEWLSVQPNRAECATEEDPFCFQLDREVSANGQALADFIDHATALPEVRFVTFSDLIRWMQDPVPLSQFDAWQQCNVTGVKADLSAVNLPAADKAGAFYLQNAGGPTATPTDAPSEAPLVTGAPSSAPDGEAVEEAPSPAPAPADAPEEAPAPLAAQRRMLRRRA